MQYANSAYRGLHRQHPEYVNDHRIKKYWDWYIDHFGDAEYLHDEDKRQAFELIEEYKKHGFEYELICIENDYKENDEEFLGIDVATRGGYSVQESGLKHDFSKSKPEQLDGIHELLYLYFQPKLNKYLLFQEKNNANLFSKVIKEMQIASPGYFEIEEFYPQYLYSIKE